MDDKSNATNDPASESTTPNADETFTFSGEDTPGTQDEDGHDGSRGAAGNVIESIRGAVDELAERAGPTVRDLSARAAPTVRQVTAKAAELTATAAVKAAPLVKRAGEATAEASTKLAEKSRGWAADLRSREDHGDEGTAPSDAAAPTAESASPAEPSGSTATPPFETTAETGTADERRATDTEG